MWGNKVRFVWMTAPEDYAWLRAQDLFVSTWAAHMPADAHPNDYTARHGFAYAAAFIGEQLAAIALVEIDESRVHFVGGLLYHQGRHVGEALKRFARHGIEPILAR